jgi:hypothetical protein
MHIHFAIALTLMALAGSIILVLPREDRLFPVLAVLASGLQALIAFGVMSLSLAKYRIDVILPATIVVASAVCWARSATKPTIAASTVVLTAGLIELLRTLEIFT